MTIPKEDERTPGQNEPEITICLCGASHSQRTCEHEFSGWREFEDGRGGEQVCKNAGSARWPILSAWIGETMLPDEIRVPLHSLQADMGYLFGRVAADGSCAAAMAQSVRERLNEIENAYTSTEASLTLTVERLRDALSKLANEVTALNAFDFKIRYVIGNTNWNVLKLREEVARTILAATERPSPTHERDGTGPESVVSDQLADANAPGRSSTEALRSALARIANGCFDADHMKAIAQDALSGSPAPSKTLGYVNVYRNDDGTLELGSADLEETPDFPVDAEEFVEFVGKGKVTLLNGGKE